MIKLINGHEKIRDIIFPFLHWNGSRKLLQCNAAPFYDTEGRFLGYRGTNLDITENQKILENLKLALNQAEENDRLKTAFLNNISHEIRTPVHAIIGYSTLLEDSGQNPEKRKLYTNIIHSASNQLISIIDDIISMATVEAGQEKINLSEFSLNLTLQNIYDQFQLKANEKGVILLLDKPLEDHQLMIKTDQIKLVQVLSNLLINAFKFTKEGTITFGYHLKEDVLYFYVKDTGIGISEEMHNLIFERFRQVDTSGIRQYGGMGLGLSISRAYVKLLGGDITLESKPGEGSTFTFTIPNVNAIKKMNPGNSLTGKEVVSVPDDKKTILIAEDEDLNYLLINEMLSGNHWQTIRTNNGVDTVEMCKTHPEIDLVLMDIKMPEMDGYEATRLIRKFRKELPIIVQSAYIHEEGRRRAFEAGADDFITKPFEKTQFNKVIKLYLAKKQLIRTYNI
ncbi:MAG: response regulator [Bacteroidales bacterium]|nr:response regulator [Bacteroidales bacterium]